MKKPMTSVAISIAAVAVAYALMLQRGSHAMERAGGGPVPLVANALREVAASDDDHAAHAMSPTPGEHIAQLAAAGDIHAGHAVEELAWSTMQAAPMNMNLPADNEGAKARLSSSSRKGEFVKITVDGLPMTTWVVHPQSGKGPVVVVIQEIFGLSDWIRGVADQLAAEGFVAVAPDLLSGKGPGGGDSTSFATVPEMQQATLMLPPAEVTSKLKAAREYGLKLPDANGKSASVGFCFGGSQSFRFAVDEPALNAAVVYYGAAPTDVPPQRGQNPAPPFMPSDRLANIKAPVLGFYGGLTQDPNVGRTVAPTEMKMKELGKVYEPHVMDGAAHGFLRAQTGNDGANMKATAQAWPMTIAWIKKYAA